MYTPNWIDLCLGGVIGFFIGKFGDAIWNIAQQSFKKTKLRRRLEKTNQKIYTNILALDHAETSYSPTDIKIQVTPYSLYFAPLSEQFDQLVEYFGFRAFKKRDYGITHFDFSTFEDFRLQLEVSKRNVAQKFIDSATKVHPLFNGQKLGVYNLRIKRVADTDRAQLVIELYKTDYFTHQIGRSLYRLLNISGDFADRINLDFFNNEFNDYKYLNTSFGLYLMIEVNEGFVFCKRSTIVSNPEEAGRWHNSVDEGLDIRDVVDGKVNMTQFAERGLKEELGLSRDTISKYSDGKIRFLDVFLEKKRYEIVLAGYLKLNMTMNKLKELYRSAPDGEYETTDVICVENNEDAIIRFFENNNVTDMAKYCVDRIIARGIF
jgi:hypothetical protein